MSFLNNAGDFVLAKQAGDLFIVRKSRITAIKIDGDGDLISYISDYPGANKWINLVEKVCSDEKYIESTLKEIALELTDSEQSD